MSSLEYLFRPIQIGPLTLKNRLIMAPMATNQGSPEGEVTDRLISYLLERVRGGVAYITTEHITVAPEGRAHANMLCLFDDRYIPGFAKLAEAVHHEGGKVFFQLNHGGRQASSMFSLGRKEIVAPSPIPCPVRGEVPRELTVEEIHQLRDAYIAAARRAKQAGADGIELHMAHSYMLCQFFSPFSNQRRDEYGGSLEGRCKFPLEVLRGVRQAIGEEFPLVCRISANEYVEGGITLGEGVRIAQALETNRADAISVSAGNTTTRHLIIAPYYQPRAVLIHLAEAVKRAVSVPVIGVGRINDPLLAEEILREEKADIIALGRALLADPYFPKKAREGRFEEIIPCIACNTGCAERLSKGLYTSCLSNPLTGNEEELKITPAPRSKQVMVIGGGPAGMHAALVAAQRGHKVSLWERGETLGGNFCIAALPPGKEELSSLLKYYENQLARSQVRVRRGVEVTAQTLMEEAPEVVVIATGSEPAVPDAPGVNEALASGFSVQATDVLKGKATAGRRVLVVGGAVVGLETADFLAERGHKVMVIEQLAELGAGMGSTVRHILLQRLKELGVITRTETALLGIEGRTVLLMCQGQTERLEDIDSVVLAVGFRPRSELADAARQQGREAHVVGDASQPRTALEAILEGHRAALTI